MGTDDRRKSLGVRVTLGELMTFQAAAYRNRMSVGEFVRGAAKEAAADCLEPTEAAPAAEATRGRKPAPPRTTRRPAR